MYSTRVSRPSNRGETNSFGGLADETTADGTGQDGPALRVVTYSTLGSRPRMTHFGAENAA